MVKLTLPYPPSLNRMYRMVGGRFLISKVGRSYKEEVEKFCMVQRFTPLDGEISVTVRAYRPERRGDLDNTFKVLLDSIKGACYHDDSQIVELHAKRFDDKLRPRIEIEIQEV